MENSERSDKFPFCYLFEVKFSIEIFVIAEERMEVDHIETETFYLVVELLSWN